MQHALYLTNTRDCFARCALCSNMVPDYLLYSPFPVQNTFKTLWIGDPFKTLWIETSSTHCYPQLHSSVAEGSFTFLCSTSAAITAVPQPLRANRYTSSSHGCNVRRPSNVVQPAFVSICLCFSCCNFFKSTVTLNITRCLRFSDAMRVTPHAFTSCRLARSCSPQGQTYKVT